MVLADRCWTERSQEGGMRMKMTIVMVRKQEGHAPPGMITVRPDVSRKSQHSQGL